MVNLGLGAKDFTLLTKHVFVWMCLKSRLVLCQPLGAGPFEPGCRENLTTVTDENHRDPVGQNRAI